MFVEDFRRKKDVVLAFFPFERYHKNIIIMVILHMDGSVAWHIRITERGRELYESEKKKVCYYIGDGCSCLYFGSSAGRSSFLAAKPERMVVAGRQW